MIVKKRKRTRFVLRLFLLYSDIHKSASYNVWSTGSTRETKRIFRAGAICSAIETGEYDSKKVFGDLVAGGNEQRFKLIEQSSEMRQNMTIYNKKCWVFDSCRLYSIKNIVSYSLNKSFIQN